MTWLAAPRLTQCMRTRLACSGLDRTWGCFGSTEIGGRRRASAPATGNQSCEPSSALATALYAMATAADGLLRYKDGRFRSITTADGLPFDRVRSLHVDRDGWLWVGTEGRGLARLDPRDWEEGKRGRVVTLRARDGLFNEVIHTILEDDADRLSMSGNRGIFWVDRRDGSRFATGRRPTIKLDGIHRARRTAEFARRTVYAAAAIRSRDGRLSVRDAGGCRGRRSGSRIRGIPFPPNVVIEQVTSGGDDGAGRSKRHIVRHDPAGPRDPVHSAQLAGASQRALPLSTRAIRCARGSMPATVARRSIPRSRPADTPSGWRQATTTASGTSGARRSSSIWRRTCGRPKLSTAVAAGRRPDRGRPRWMARSKPPRTCTAAQPTASMSGRASCARISISSSCRPSSSRSSTRRSPDLRQRQPRVSNAADPDDWPARGSSCARRAPADPRAAERARHGASQLPASAAAGGSDPRRRASWRPGQMKLRARRQDLVTFARGVAAAFGQIADAEPHRLRRRCAARTDR